MKAPYTMFNQTKNVEVEVYLNGKKIDSDTWDKEYWVQRGEDEYGLSSSSLRNKRVRVVRRDEWLKSELIKDQ